MGVTFKHDIVTIKVHPSWSKSFGVQKNKQSFVGVHFPVVVVEEMAQLNN